MNDAFSPSSISPYLTLAEAARYARCSVRTVQRWLSTKKLNRYGHGKHVLVRQDELEAFLAAPEPA